MKFKVVIILILLILIGFFAIKSYRKKTSPVIYFPNDLKIELIKKEDVLPRPYLATKNKNPGVSAYSVVLMDAPTKVVLYEKDSRKRVPIASTTKIMTGIIVLENYNLSDTITISKTAAATIGSDIQLRTNEKMTVENLLKALLVQSGNDAAVALSEKIGTEEFVKKMNEKAKEFGMKDTMFKDPAGLDDSGYSTPYDLAILTSYALQNEKFSQIVQTKEADIVSADGKLGHKLESSNRLLFENKIYYPYALGVKTGFTPAAGHCLVSAAQKDNHLLIGVILNTYKNTVEASAIESRKLLSWGFDNFEWK